jgi:hypothetical protein
MEGSVRIGEEKRIKGRDKNLKNILKNCRRNVWKESFGFFSPKLFHYIKRKLF